MSRKPHPRHLGCGFDFVGVEKVAGTENTPTCAGWCLARICAGIAPPAKRSSFFGLAKKERERRRDSRARAREGAQRTGNIWKIPTKADVDHVGRTGSDFVEFKLRLYVQVSRIQDSIRLDPGPCHSTLGKLLRWHSYAI
jgi:hypothetical protein